MKKFLLFAATAAAVLLAASCNKGGQDSKATVLPAAKNVQEAKKLLLTPSDKLGIVSIEFTEGGRYIVRNQVTHAGDDAEYIRGTYTVSGQVYTLSGFGKVTITNNQVTIERQGGETTTVGYTQAETYPQNDFYLTVARAWKVDKTDLSVNIDGKSVGVVKSGCDVPAIVAELKQKASLNINEATVAGFVVKEINFTLAKTIEVAFTEKESFVGQINLSPSGDFSYKLEGSTGNSIINGSASGKLDNTIENGKLYFTINGNVETDGGKTYTARVIFILSPAA